MKKTGKTSIRTRLLGLLLAAALLLGVVPVVTPQASAAYDFDTTKFDKIGGVASGTYWDGSSWRATDNYRISTHLGKPASYQRVTLTYTGYQDATNIKAIRPSYTAFTGLRGGQHITTITTGNGGYMNVTGAVQPAGWVAFETQNSNRSPEYIRVTTPLTYKNSYFYEGDEANYINLTINDSQFYFMQGTLGKLGAGKTFEPCTTLKVKTLALNNNHYGSSDHVKYPINFETVQTLALSGNLGDEGKIVSLKAGTDLNLSNTEGYLKQLEATNTLAMDAAKITVLESATAGGLSMSNASALKFPAGSALEFNSMTTSGEGNSIIQLAGAGEKISAITVNNSPSSTVTIPQPIQVDALVEGTEGTKYVLTDGEAFMAVPNTQAGTKWLLDESDFVSQYQGFVIAHAKDSDSLVWTNSQPMVHVDGGALGSQDYFSLNAALTAIAGDTDANGAYTVTLLSNQNLWKEDLDLLATIGAGKSITFTGSSRNPGVSGQEQHRLRFRVADIKMPKGGAGIKFENIVLAFEVASPSFYANGSPLTFGDSVQMVNHSPDVYAGGQDYSDNGSSDLALTLLSGSFRNVYGGGNGTYNTSGSSIVTIGSASSTAANAVSISGDVWAGSKNAGGRIGTGVKGPKVLLRYGVQYASGTSFYGTLSGGTDGPSVLELSPNLSIKTPNIMRFSKIVLNANSTLEATTLFSASADDTLSVTGEVSMGTRSRLILPDADNRVGKFSATGANAEVQLYRRNDGADVSLTITNNMSSADVSHANRITLTINGDPALVKDTDENLVKFSYGPAANASYFRSGITGKGIKDNKITGYILTGVAPGASIAESGKIYDGEVTLVVDADNSSGNGFTGVRWFRVPTTDTTNYVQSMATEGTTFEEGFRAAALDDRGGSVSLKGSALLDGTVLSASNTLVLDPASPAGSASWSLKVKENGIYWVEVEYQQGGSTVSRGVASVRVDNLFTSINVMVRGAVMGTGSTAVDTWLYGGNNSWDQVRLADGSVSLEQYGIPLEMNTDPNATFAEKVKNIVPSENNDYYDSLTLNSQSRFLRYYTAKLGNGEGGLSTKPTEVTLTLNRATLDPTYASFSNRYYDNGMGTNYYTFYYTRSADGAWKTVTAKYAGRLEGIPDDESAQITVDGKTSTSISVPLDFDAATNSYSPNSTKFLESGGSFFPASDETYEPVGYYYGREADIKNAVRLGRWTPTNGNMPLWTAVADWATFDPDYYDNDGKELFIVYSANARKVEVEYRMKLSADDKNPLTFYTKTFNIVQGGKYTPEELTVISGYVPVAYTIENKTTGVTDGPIAFQRPDTANGSIYDSKPVAGREIAFTELGDGGMKIVVTYEQEAVRDSGIPASEGATIVVRSIARQNGVDTVLATRSIGVRADLNQRGWTQTVTNDGSELGNLQDVITDDFGKQWHFAEEQASRTVEVPKTAGASVNVDFVYSLDEDDNGVKDSEQYILEKYKIEGTDTEIAAENRVYVKAGDNYTGPAVEVITYSGQEYALFDAAVNYAGATEDSGRVTINNLVIQAATWKPITVEYHYQLAGTVDMVWTGVTISGSEIELARETLKYPAGVNVKDQIIAARDAKANDYPGWTLIGTTLDKQKLDLDTTPSVSIQGGKTQTLVFKYQENVALYQVRGVTNGQNPITLYSYTLSRSHSDNSLTIEALDQTGYQVINGRVLAADGSVETGVKYTDGKITLDPKQGGKTVEFIYEDSSASIKIKLVDKAGKEIADPVYLTGYHKGDTVTVAGPNVEGYVIFGSRTQTVHLDTAGEKEISFQYNDRAKVYFTLVERTADGDKIIKVVNGEEGKTYSPTSRTNAALNLSGEYYDFVAEGSTAPFDGGGDKSVTITAADLASEIEKPYTLYYTKQTRDIQLNYLEWPANTPIKTETLTGAGRLGETFQLEAEYLPGYHVKNGTVKLITVGTDTTPLEVNLYYEKKPAGSVTVNYKVNNKTVESYTVQAAVGETFTATIPDSLQNQKYLLDVATSDLDNPNAQVKQKSIQSVSDDPAQNEINVNYKKNFALIKTWIATDKDAVQRVKDREYEYIFGSTLEITVPTLSGYELKGILQGGNGKANELPVGYLDGRLTLPNAVLPQITGNTDIVLCYVSIEDNIDQYSSIVNVTYNYNQGANGKTYTLGTEKLVKNVNVDDGNTTVTVTPKEFEGYQVVSSQLNGQPVAFKDSTKKTVEVTWVKGNPQELSFTYERTDGGTSVPGPDTIMGTDDDVIVKPGADGKTPTVNGDGNVEVPKDGGSVEYPSGEVITPPEGSVVKPDGTIVTPEGGEIKPPKKEVDPVNPDPIDVPDGYATITYLPNGGVGKVQRQVVKKGVQTKTLANSFTHNVATFRVWSTFDTDNGGKEYNPGDDITVEENTNLFARWDNSYGNEAAIKFWKNSGEEPEATSTQTIRSNATPIRGTLGANTWTVVVNNESWTFWRWSTVRKSAAVTIGGVLSFTGTNYADQAEIVLQAGAQQDLYAQWYKLGDDGSITIPGEDGKPGTDDDIVIKGNGEENPTPNPDGSVTVPEGGTVTTPDGSVTLPEGGKVNPDGSITKNPDGETVDPTDPVPANGWSFTYLANFLNDKGTTDESKHIVDQGKTTTVSGGVFTRKGYLLASWNTKPVPDAQSKYYYVGTAMNQAEHADLNLYAQWYEHGNDGSITVPGGDLKIDTEGDNVTVKPSLNDPDKKPSIDKSNGYVNVPSGGEIILPSGEKIVPPDNTRVQPDGTILFPDGSTVDPSKNPATPPAGYISVIYKPNGGVGEQYKQFVKANNAYLVLDCRFTNGAMQFTGWQNEKDSNKKVTSNSTETAGSEDIVWLALWDDNGAVNAANVDFHKNDNSGASERQTFQSGDSEVFGGKLKANPFVLAGWTFAGWDTNASGGGTHYADRDMVALQKGELLELYALWYRMNDDGSIDLPGKDLQATSEDDVKVEGPAGGANPTPNTNGSINVPAGGTAQNPSMGGKVQFPQGATVNPNGSFVLGEGQTAILPDGTNITGPATVDPDGTPEYGANAEMVTIQFFDWDGTPLGTRTLRKGGSLTGLGNGDDQAPEPQVETLTSAPTVTSPNGLSVVSKAGYTFAGWVDYNESSTPLVSKNTAAGQTVDNLVSLDNIQTSMTLRAAYNETGLGKLPAQRNYTIERSAFVLATQGLEAEIFVARGEKARRGNVEELYLQVVFTPKDSGATTMMLKLGASDLESTLVYIPIEAGVSYESVRCSVVSVIDGKQQTMSSFFTIAPEEMAEGK